MFTTEKVTDMSHMFKFASEFTGKGLQFWDVSRIQTFDSMFHQADSFDADIGKWDVSGADVFTSMFDGAHSFNQDIGRWDIEGVVEVKDMFRNARSFSQPLCWELNNTQEADLAIRGPSEAGFHNSCNHKERDDVVRLVVSLLLMVSCFMFGVYALNRFLRSRQTWKSEAEDTEEEEEIMFGDSIATNNQLYFDDEIEVRSYDHSSDITMHGSFAAASASEESNSLESAASDLAAMIAKSTDWHGDKPRFGSGLV